MHDQTMTLEQFEEHLDLHGSSIERWPVAAARDARKLLAESRDARAQLRAAGALDALLDEAMPAATPSTGAVRARILAEVAERASRPAWWAWLADGIGARRPAAIVVALVPLCVGFAIGLGYESRGAGDEFAADVNLLALVDYEGYADAN